MSAFSPVDGMERIDFSIQSDVVSPLRSGGTTEDGARVLWTNAVCAAFLLIGFLGIKDPRPPIPAAVRPAEVAVVPVEFIPSVPDPSTSAVEGPAADGGSARPTVETPQPVVAEVSAADVTLATPVADVPTPRWKPDEPGSLPVQAGVSRAASDAAGVGVAESAGSAGSGDGPRVFRAGDGTNEGIIAPVPDYPMEARRRGVDGVVKLEVAVGELGTVENIRILASSGTTLLDQHTVGWVKRRWKFPAGRRQLLHTEFVYRLTDGR